MKKVYNDLELRMYLLIYRSEWMEDNIERLSEGKPIYSFNDWLERCYSKPDEFDESVLTQLFDAQIIDMIPFGHWCVQCGAPISTEGSDYCDPCMIATEELE